MSVLFTIELRAECGSENKLLLAKRGNQAGGAASSRKVEASG
jgi:hypothetical protein